MTISLLQSKKQKSGNIVPVCMLAAVYLLVVLYSLSHTHGETEDFSPKLLAQYQPSLIHADDAADNWHPDQHHTGVCKLVCQASGDLAAAVVENLFDDIQRTVFRACAFPLPTPTSRVTRAPPEAVA